MYRHEKISLDDWEENVRLFKSSQMLQQEKQQSLKFISQKIFLLDDAVDSNCRE